VSDPTSPFHSVTVTPYVTTDDVVWTAHDGKPRCAKHPYICLVLAPAVGLKLDGHVCARCMRQNLDERKRGE
jgi:hypothetical protein